MVESMTVLATVLLIKKRWVLNVERITEEEESGFEYERQTFRDEDRSVRWPFYSSCAGPLAAMKIGETVGSEVAYPPGTQSTP